MAEAYIFDALRTPRSKGENTGALYEVKPVSLLAATLDAVLKRNSISPEQIEDVIIGCATPVNDQGGHIAQAALLYAGWASAGKGIQINRYGASGLEAINLAAMKVRSGWGEIMLAGGVESMSRVPPGSDGGPLLYDPEVFSKAGQLPQGIAADLLASLEGLSRETLDSYALESCRRAAHAVKNGYFSSSIIPIYDRNGLLILAEDEGVGQLLTQESLAQLPPAYAALGQMGFDEMALRQHPWLEHIRHVHTQGNSGNRADGAALALVGSQTAGEALGLAPRARIRAVAAISNEPGLMLDSPAAAARKALQIAGMAPSDIGLWECNEVYAAVVLKFQRELDIDAATINVNGGAIALGHPLGATGAMLLGSLLDELERRDLNTGLIALSTGGGIGVATIIERV